MAVPLRSELSGMSLNAGRNRETSQSLLIPLPLMVEQFANSRRSTRTSFLRTSQRRWATAVEHRSGTPARPPRQPGIALQPSSPSRSTPARLSSEFLSVLGRVSTSKLGQRTLAARGVTRNWKPFSPHLYIQLTRCGLSAKRERMPRIGFPLLNSVEI